MPHFRDPEASLRSMERLSETAGTSLMTMLNRALKGNADPDLALTNLERWAAASGSPRLYLAHLGELPERTPLFLGMLGASQPLADALIQNPELASLVLEPGEIGVPTPADELLDEGRKLLAAATSQSHALDRLRFLRQRHIVPIVVADLSALWEQETVWRALSDLADALVQLCIEATWPPFARLKDLDPTEPPLGVVAFGKLGGHELNYSSDIDLVYVAKDGIDERTERELTRYCEVLGRALTDRMGRGSLYRVDLRLRPYGSAGAILRKVTAVEHYYRLYAEPWEAQALLRSRVIAGEWLTPRWESLVAEIAFPPVMSEGNLAEMVATRRRIEEIAQGDDLKRGPGGIRDVEFLVQSLQMAYGHDNPSLRSAATCAAIRALAHAGHLESADARTLIEGYAFLRKLEHRVQLVGDQQTHSLPEDANQREAIARTMGFSDPKVFIRALGTVRRTVGTLYRSILRLDSQAEDARSIVAQRAGSHGPALLAWFDGIPEAEAYYALLNENEGSLHRAVRLLSEAPRLVGAFRNNLSITELLMSGEIEEASPDRLPTLPPETPIESVAHVAAADFAALCARWTLQPNFRLEEGLCRQAENILTRFAAEGLDIVALGSFGLEDLTPGSDLDLLLLTGGEQAEAEKAAQALLSDFGRLMREGAPFQMDLRLRPEGRKGLLVRTYDGLLQYAMQDMETWERFALGHARLVTGSPRAVDTVRFAVRERPLTGEELTELKKMKRRIETERVRPAHAQRDVKLGRGSLGDIEWLVRLTEMVHPGDRAPSSRIHERIESLTQAGHFNLFERDSLLEAHTWLLDLRHRLWLLDGPDDLLPENPERLGRLATMFGMTDGNALLKRHADLMDRVRDLYETGVARLGA